MPKSSQSEKVVEISRGAGDGEVKGKRAAPQDVAKFMQLVQRQGELKEAIVDSSLTIALQTTRHEKSVAALADLNVEFGAHDVFFAKKYGIVGKYIVTPDGLIIEQG